MSFAQPLALEPAAHVAATANQRKGEWLLSTKGFSYHELPPYFVSLLIEDGVDVKKVRAAMRHASAKTMPGTYSHLWPRPAEVIRAAGEKVLRARAVAQEGAANESETPKA